MKWYIRRMLLGKWKKLILVDLGILISAYFSHCFLALVWIVRNKTNINDIITANDKQVAQIKLHKFICKVPHVTSSDA